ncbi:vWA domain-containing protein [Zavarzinia sp. CC-PAN008]|uniref:vWA domain-containing protein n=1 Tax=Zavarzinia sp. CC-PAN008 TaxID=3243332 RepID=UPI003F7457A7
MTDLTATRLVLDADFDRGLALVEGQSVRYLVAALSAEGPPPAPQDAPPLNLALSIDVSGSMSGDKLDAARRAATAVAQAMGERDRLSVVAFDDTVRVLLDGAHMDRRGRDSACAAIASLQVGGSTALFDGWMTGAERVAVAMLAAPQATHRVLLLSDGQANVGIVDRGEIATHAGALLDRGIVTSTVGIGDGYDELLMGALAEAGGGSLHDAATTAEIGELVLGEFRGGRSTLVERVALRLDVPAHVQAEVVGPWSARVLSGTLEVQAGNLLPGQVKQVVVRLHCAAGAEGSLVPMRVSAQGALPGTTAEVEAVRDLALRMVRGGENRTQPRDMGRSLAVVQAWQAVVLRKAVELNRSGDRRAAKHYLERELRWMEPYARGVPGAEALVADLVLVQRRVGEQWDERTRKEVYAEATRVSKSEVAYSMAPRRSLSERFGK